MEVTRKAETAEEEAAATEEVTKEAVAVKEVAVADKVKREDGRHKDYPRVATRKTSRQLGPEADSIEPRTARISQQY